MPPRFSYEPLYDRADGNTAWAIAMARDVAERMRSSPLVLAGTIPVQPDPKPSEEVDPLETLFEVFVVSKARKVILHEFAVAKDEAGAQFRAGVDKALRDAALEPDDVTILCKAVGQVEVEKKPQRMKIVGDEATPTA